MCLLLLGLSCVFKAIAYFSWWDCFPPQSIGFLSHAETVSDYDLVIFDLSSSGGIGDSLSKCIVKQNLSEMIFSSLWLESVFTLSSSLKSFSTAQEGSLLVIRRVVNLNILGSDG